MRWRNLQVADTKATQFIRDCKYEPDKYVRRPLCHVAKVYDGYDKLQSALAATGEI